MGIAIRMTEYGSGWRFTVTNDDQATEYRTNENGRGLWQLVCRGTMYRDTGGQWQPYREWQQVEGTGQFTLPSDRRRAYGRIRRAWNQEGLS